MKRREMFICTIQNMFSTGYPASRIFLLSRRDSRGKISKGGGILGMNLLQDTASACIQRNVYG